MCQLLGKAQPGRRIVRYALDCHQEPPLFARHIARERIHQRLVTEATIKRFPNLTILEGPSDLTCYNPHCRHRCFNLTALGLLR